MLPTFVIPLWAIITVKTWPDNLDQSWPSMFLKSYCFVSELGRSDRSAVLPEVEQPQDEHLGRVREAEDQRELRRRDARVGRSKNHQVPSDPPVCRQRVSAVSRALNDARFFVLWTEILKKMSNISPPSSCQIKMVIDTSH